MKTSEENKMFLEYFEKLDKAQHLTDEELLFLQGKFADIITVLGGLPHYRIVIRDAVENLTKIDVMLDRRWKEKKALESQGKAS